MSDAAHVGEDIETIILSLYFVQISVTHNIGKTYNYENIIIISDLGAL